MLRGENIETKTCILLTRNIRFLFESRDVGAVRSLIDHGRFVSVCPYLLNENSRGRCSSRLDGPSSENTQCIFTQERKEIEARRL